MSGFFGMSGWAIEPATEPESGGGALMAAEHVVRRGNRGGRRVDADATSHEHDTNTGVSNPKLGDLAVPLVGGAVLRRVHLDVLPVPRPRRAVLRRAVPTPDKFFNIPFTSVTSFILLMSSLTMVLALAAIQRGDHRRFRIWLLATALFGATFIGGQVYEFTEFYRKGLHLCTNMFGTTFYVLTGLHGAHVTMGIIWLLILWGRSMQGQLPEEQAEAVEIAGLYWHFVDIVWIFIFTAVYLIPQH